MSHDDLLSSNMDSSIGLTQPNPTLLRNQEARMHYRNRPVTVAVDPISLVISECISITSAIQKHARSPHSSVSVILGGNPNPIQLGAPATALKSRRKPPTNGVSESEPISHLENRWGLRGQRGKSMQDNPMIAGFGKLRYEIAGAKDIHTFDAPLLLAPFLTVIQTKGTAAPITILALGALRKFLAYGFICPGSPRFAVAMQSLSAAVTHCQFDISDSAQGEVVLLMILNLMEDMLSGPGGDILSDESVCDIMGRGLAICSQPRFSPVLRRTAEAVMVRMCQIIFEDIKHLEVEAGPSVEMFDRLAQEDAKSVTMDTASASLDVNLVRAAPEIDGPVATGSLSAQTEDEPEDASDPRLDHNPLKECDGGLESRVGENQDNDETDSLDLRPYSLPSVRELFRVLVSFLDPNDRQHTDTTRVMAMRIIHVAFEVSGPSIARHPTLASVAEDRLCSYLFQLVRSDNMAVLQESLMVAGTLLATCRGILKLQQELFLSYLVACLHPTVEIPREPGIDPSLYAGIPQTPKLVKPPPPSQPSSGRATPVPVKDRQKLGLEGGARKPEARQAMVESIGVLSRMPTFAAELFVNYDCDQDRADLCEDMIGLLSRNALPDSATWSTTSVPPLCLDALLKYVQFITERLHETPVFSGFPDPSELRERRSRKKIVIKGANLFNEKPKAGLAYLESHGILKDGQDPQQVAKFLKGTSRISKAVLGDFLSKRGNEAILTAFMDQFDFSGKRIDEALRSLLETFRLPGEAPLIAAIVEVFSERYCSTTQLTAEIANKDGAYILTYAIILLNTDQHNPNMKDTKRMTLDGFLRNLRGQNDGKDFSAAYLREIYESIKSNEIILPDEHDNQHAFDYAWRELMSKSATSGRLILCDTNIYDADMFATTWRPVVSTLSYVFMSASDDAVFARIVTGFDECARIATKYRNQEALDQIIYCLSQMTTLGTAQESSTALNTEVQVGDSSVMVSELAVKLGRDFRAQLATLVLFRVIRDSEALIKDGWKHIVKIWHKLFVNSLAPRFSASSVNLPASFSTIPLQTPSQVIDKASRTSDTGFFTAFTSYISSYAADDPPEPSDEELESSLCTVDCISSCDIDLIYENIGQLPIPAVIPLVEALLGQMPENEQSGVVTVKQTNQSTPPTRHQLTVALKYDPAVAYILEFSTLLATRDAETIKNCGKHVFDILQNILREASQWHPIIVSRATFYALMMLKASYVHNFANVPFLLHTIASLPDEMLTQTSSLILNGLSYCTDEPGSLRSEVMTSPDFWLNLRKLARDSESAAAVFSILEKSTSGFPPAIMADNYVAAVELLGSFASAAAPSEADHTTTVGGGTGPVQKQPDSDAVARGRKAINILYSLTSRIPQLVQQSQLDSSEAWSAYWLPVFKVLVLQCTNPCREVRQLSFSSLQRSLLSPSLNKSNTREWNAIFGKVLFPLILRLLKPEVFSTDRDGMSEMRVQAASLLCKVFLQYLVLLSGSGDLLDLWVRVIEIMDRLVNSGQGDSLEEAVRENLKNVVLFMASSGCLVSPNQDPSKRALWTATWKRIDRFMPDLKHDLNLVDEGQESKSLKEQHPDHANGAEDDEIEGDEDLLRTMDTHSIEETSKVREKSFTEPRVDDAGQRRTSSSDVD